MFFRAFYTNSKAVVFLLACLLLTVACAQPEAEPTAVNTQLPPTTQPPTETSPPTTVVTASETPSPTLPPATPTAPPPTPTLPPPTPTQPPPPLTPIVTGNLFYVSTLGDNQDGLSWATAWDELDQIDWSVIEPGDMILLDGGEQEMVYRTTLEFEQSGRADQPITIALAAEEGRNGQAIFFGGREDTLPGYCGTADYEETTTPSEEYGIWSNDETHIIVDGRKWHGIYIHGYGRSGIRINSQSENLTFRNLTITNNGDVRWDDEYDTWISDQPGVILGGRDITFQRVIIHDNGQDAIQSLWEDNGLANFTLEESWLYNGTHLPINLEDRSQDCLHSDGIQIYDGGTISGVTIRNTIIGPGFMNSLILGQTETSNGAYATVNDVTLNNVLLIKPTDNAILNYPNVESDGWRIDGVTADCPLTAFNCLSLEGQNHTIVNSLFRGANIHIGEDADVATENNCLWQTTGVDIGTEANPQFTNVNGDDWLILEQDYTVQNSDCAALGASLTSPQQLLLRKDGQP